MMLPQARMATGASGTWVLYVLTDASALEWPGHDFGRVAPMPTPQECATVLTGLGYSAGDGAGWKWDENRPAPAHPHLVLAVRSLPLNVTGGGAA
ncbi:DUF6303 family protein [Streptomyces sp. JAC18]|uniref:DUF6303 family protein n=1 Tax=Streptomyces sp. JAC18 TaxID=3418414 RepID=UPI003D81A3A1